MYSDEDITDAYMDYLKDHSGRLTIVDVTARPGTMYDKLKEYPKVQYIAVETFGDYKEKYPGKVYSSLNEVNIPDGDKLLLINLDLLPRYSMIQDFILHISNSPSTKILVGSLESEYLDNLSEWLELIPDVTILPTTNDNTRLVILPVQIESYQVSWGRAAGSNNDLREYVVKMLEVYYSKTNTKLHYKTFIGDKYLPHLTKRFGKRLTVYSTKPGDKDVSEFHGVVDGNINELMKKDSFKYMLLFCITQMFRGYSEKSIPQTFLLREKDANIINALVKVSKKYFVVNIGKASKTTLEKSIDKDVQFYIVVENDITDKALPKLNI